MPAELVEVLLEKWRAENDHYAEQEAARKEKTAQREREAWMRQQQQEMIAGLKGKR